MSSLLPKYTAILAVLEQHHYIIHTLIIHLNRICIHINENVISNKMLFYEYRDLNSSISVFRCHIGTSQDFFGLKIVKKSLMDRVEWLRELLYKDASYINNAICEMQSSLSAYFMGWTSHVLCQKPKCRNSAINR